MDDRVDDSSSLDLVEKLRKQLSDATKQEKQESHVLKILKKLSLLPMTLEILQATHIGKQVNSLRKAGGQVGEKSKSLVRKWKKLVPDSEQTTTAHHSAATTLPTNSSSSNSCSNIHNSGAGTISNHHQHRHRQDYTPSNLSRSDSSSSSRRRHGAPVIVIDSDNDRDNDINGGVQEEDVVMVSHSSTSPRQPHQSRSTHLSRDNHLRSNDHKLAMTKVSNHQRQVVISDDSGDFSRALEMPLHPKSGESSKATKRITHSLTSYKNSRQKARSSSTKSETVSDVMCLDVLSTPSPHTSPNRLAGSMEQPPNPRAKSPISNDLSSGDVIDDVIGVATGSRKRIANVESRLDVVSLAKRSKTLVYSGKKSSSTGPQVVSSLFNLCMKILLDNIDAIEEVGPGVPYHVLEPVLQKCTAIQLEKLEYYNPHLLEDTDELWKKHHQKDFKIGKPSEFQSWRELHFEKRKEREEKLKYLTARIKKTEEKRQEPVRKAKIAEVGRKPGRRSGQKTTSFFVPGRSGGGGSGFSRPLEKHSQLSGLKKKTMKMAIERNQMIMHRPGKR